MELRDYLRIARRRAWLLATVTIVCASAALVASLSTMPVYQAKAQLMVAARTGEGGPSAYEGALLSQQLSKSFARMLQSRKVAEAALALDPQPFEAQQLQAKVRAETVPDTLLIDLRVEDIEQERARRLANTVARAFIRSLPSLQSGSALKVSLVEPALTPTEPVRPRTRLNVVLGLLLGLVLGGGLAVLRDLLDRSIKTPSELEEATGAALLGAIPPFKAARQALPVAESPRTPVAEAFRKLRTNFAFLGVDRNELCCVVTSPTPADGKSTVTANLGVALAQAGERVVIVDADLRRPIQHKLFGLSQQVGTTTVLMDRTTVHDALQHLGPDMPAVLPAGQLPPNPAELLGSRRMAELLAELRTRFDVVLVDCAPLLPVADPMVAAQFADGVLLIARAGTTTRDQAQAARAGCAKAGVPLFGTVLNATKVTEGGQQRSYAYYGERSEAEAGAEPSDRQPATAPAVGNGTVPHRVESGRAARHLRVRSGARR